MAARNAQQILEAMLGAKDSQLALMMARIEELEEQLKDKSESTDSANKKEKK